jgi:ParB family transcriptional regulator, chromosome partitioning protein
MSEAAVEPPRTPEQPIAERAPPPAGVNDYLVLKIADLDQKTVPNIRELDKEALKELTADVRIHGVLEPVLVRESGGKFQLLAGNRRVAAAKAAGLTHVPARILELTDAETLEVQLTENLQRVDLSAMEEARGFKAYLDATKKTQLKLAARIGKSQPYVANRLRLLGLPGEVQALVDEGKLAATHAEVLLKIPKEAAPIIVQAAKDAAKQGTSARDLDRDVSWKAKKHLEAIAFKKRVDESKFPNCPTCKKRASEMNYDGTVDHGQYEEAHRWSLATGKTAREVIDAARSKVRKESAARGADKRAKLPVVDRSQPNVIHAAQDPLAITKKMLEQLSSECVRLVELEPAYTGETRLVLTFVAKGAPKLSFAGDRVRLVPASYSTGERTAVVVPSYHVAKDRKRVLGVAAKWQSSSLVAPKLKDAKSFVVDDKLLKGSIDEVLPRVAKHGDDIEALEAIRTAEAAGKARGGILDWIDGRFWNARGEEE